MSFMLPATDFLFRFICFALCHSLLASNMVKQRLNFGAAARYDGYRIIYNILSIILLAWVMSDWSSAPVVYVAAGGWYLLLRGMQLILVVLLAKCLHQTGIGVLLGITRQGPTSTLVTSGCYGRVRHPLYTLTILFMLCEPAPSAKWLLLTLASAIYCGLASRLEERRLLDQFGAAYREYQGTVPAFLPRLKANR